MRRQSFRRNAALDVVLRQLEKPMESAGVSLLSQCTDPSSAEIVFIIGAPRSGSTLLSSLAALTGAFAYPSNFMSRLYRAPHFGFLLQELLFNPKLQFRDELRVALEVDVESELGKTVGAMSPHEMNHFWRRWLIERNNAPPQLPINGNFSQAAAELDCWAKLAKKPLIMKGHFVQWELDALQSACPNATFAFLKRDTLYNAQSLLMARKQFAASKFEWYSFYPKNSADLIAQEPVEQVVEQVLRINEEVSLQLATLATDKVVEIHYHEMITAPLAVLCRIGEMCGIDPPSCILPTLKSRDIRKLDRQTFNQLENYVENARRH